MSGGLFSRAIKGDRSYLVKRLNLAGLWDELSDQQILTTYQIQECRSEKTPMEQVSKVLDHLDKRDNVAFIPFCKILVADGQVEVARKLAEKVGQAHNLNAPPATQQSTAAPQPTTRTTAVNNTKCPLCGDRHNPDFPWKFKCFINGKRTALIEELDVSGNFFDTLQQSGVLGKMAKSKIAISEIRHKGDEFAQKRELLDKLEKCDDNKYDDFLKVLESQEQLTIVQIITNHFKNQPETNDTDRAYTAGASATVPMLPQPHGRPDVIQPEYPEDDFDVSVTAMKKTSDEFLRKCKDQAFPMTSEPRGTALIINIYKTSGMPDREGTQADRDNLVKLFKKLHFNVKVYSDINENGEPEQTRRLKPTAENILKFIKTTLEEMKSKEQCFILATLSHGGINDQGQEVLYGCDGKEVTKKAILDVVDVLTNDEDFSDLKDIPRLVIFQCCRGEKQMLRELTDCSDVRINTIYCHSCTRDFVSYRNSELGTRFVRAFVDTFTKHAHDTDIVGLMDKVKEAMKKIDPKKIFDQIPQHVYHPLFEEKKLYFFP